MQVSPPPPPPFPHMYIYTPCQNIDLGVINEKDMESELIVNCQRSTQGKLVSQARPFTGRETKASMHIGTFANLYDETLPRLYKRMVRPHQCKLPSKIMSTQKKFKS